jgi:hypothetical protein
MSGFSFLDPDTGPQDLAQGGTPGFGELADASYEQARLIGNVGGRDEQMARAYEARNARIKQAFGVALPNPVRDWHSFDPATERGRVGRLPENSSQARSDMLDWYQRKTAMLAAQNPDRYRALALDKPADIEADEIAQAAIARGNELASRTTGTVMPMIASLWGGLKASPFDPVNVATLPLGGGGRTVLMRVFSAAAANAGTELASAPLTATQKREAGMETGIGETAKDMAVAGVFGGGVQGAGEALAAGLRRGGRALTPEQKIVQAAQADPAKFRAAMAGDDKALADIARSVAGERDDVRGAATVMRQEAALEARRPANVDAAEHVRAVDDATRYLDDPHASAPVIPQPVPERAATRVADTFADLPEPQPGQRLMLDGRPYDKRSLDPRALGFEADTFQYKLGGDARGVRNDLASVDKWDAMAAQAVMAFERKDGRLLVADGHQRTGLATRLLAEGKEKAIGLDAFVFREADGWTPSEVRALAARRNLQQRTGDPTDTAVAIRDMPQILDRTVARGSEHMRVAQGLARLTPEVFQMVRGGALPQAHGQLIGWKVPQGPRQAAAADALIRTGIKGTESVAAFLDQINALETRAGGEIADLFGEASVARSLAVEVAELLPRVAKALKSDKSAFARVNGAAEALASEGNVIAREANAARAEASGAGAVLVQKLATVDGPVRDIILDGARRIANGEKPGKIADHVSSEIAGLVKERGANALLPRATRTIDGVQALSPRLDAPAGPDAVRQVDDLMRDAMRQPTEAPLRLERTTLAKAFGDDVTGFPLLGKQQYQFNNEVVFNIRQDQRLVGYALVDPPPSDGVATIRAIRSVGETPMSFGTVATRSLVGEIKREFPDAKAITGFRQTGARQLSSADGQGGRAILWFDADAKAANARAELEWLARESQIKMEADAPEAPRERQAPQQAASDTAPARAAEAPAPDGMRLNADSGDGQASLLDMVPGEDTGRMEDGLKAGSGALRSREDVLAEIRRLDERETVITACIGGSAP